MRESRRTLPDEALDVVIVGAGLSGLMAARTLTRAGLRVLVFESSNYVGGQVRTVADIGLDVGAYGFSPRDESLLALLHETGLSTYVGRAEGDALYEHETWTQRYDGNPFRSVEWRPHGGFGALVGRITDDLPCASVRTGSRVQAIEHDHDGTVRVRTSRGEISASAVILALEPRLASHIEFTPPLSLEPPAGELAATRTQVLATYPRAFWRDHELAGTAHSTRGPFSVIEDASGPDDAPAALRGLANGTLHDATALFIEQLARLFGAEAAAPDIVYECSWMNATWPATPAPPPRVAAESYDGRLIWGASATTSHGSGRLEGAVIAGRSAAKRAGARLAGGLDLAARTPTAS